MMRETEHSSKKNSHGSFYLSVPFYGADWTAGLSDGISVGILYGKSQRAA